MRLPGLPRLPVSRRRHEREVQRMRDGITGLTRKLTDAYRQRDELRARVAELEQAIRSHRDHQFPEGSHDAVQRFEQAMAVNRKLWAVLHSQERQERDTRAAECVERWPECETGSYDPRCCRFPKSCSADVHYYDRQEPPRLSDTGWYPGVERDFAEGSGGADGDH